MICALLQCCKVFQRSYNQAVNSSVIENAREMNKLAFITGSFDAQNFSGKSQNFWKKEKTKKKKEKRKGISTEISRFYLRSL